MTQLTHLIRELQILKTSIELTEGDLNQMRKEVKELERKIEEEREREDEM